MLILCVVSLIGLLSLDPFSLFTGVSGNRRVMHQETFDMFGPSHVFSLLVF